jgi:hypothetical protein
MIPARYQEWVNDPDTAERRRNGSLDTLWHAENPLRL